jgi:hypothetical protein
VSAPSLAWDILLECPSGKNGEDNFGRDQEWSQGASADLTGVIWNLNYSAGNGCGLAELEALYRNLAGVLPWGF